MQSCSLKKQLAEHFLTPPLVYLQNDDQGMSKEFRTDDALLLRSG